MKSVTQGRYMTEAVGCITITHAFMTLKDAVASVTYTDMTGQTIKEVAGNTFTDYTYDKSGSQVVTYTGSLLEGESDKHTVNLQLYDKSGNQTYEISQPGVSGNAYTIAEGSIVTSSEYDEAGNVVMETDGEGVKTKYAYDDENRITDIYLDYEDENTPVSLHADYSISDDGVTTTVLTDANGNTKTEQTDAAGNIIMTEDSEADDTGEKITVRNEYDELRRLNQTDYSDGSFIIYTYDGNSDRVTIKEAYKGGDLESRIETEYGDKERPFMITCRDASGNIRYNTVYDYTAEGSVSEIRTTDTSGNTDTTQYGYDSEGRLTQKAIHQLQDWVSFHISMMWQDTIPEYQIVTV